MGCNCTQLRPGGSSAHSFCSFRDFKPEKEKTNPVFIPYSLHLRCHRVIIAQDRSHEPSSLTKESGLFLISTPEMEWVAISVFWWGLGSTLAYVELNPEWAIKTIPHPSVGLDLCSLGKGHDENLQTRRFAEMPGSESKWHKTGMVNELWRGGKSLADQVKLVAAKSFVLKSQRMLAVSGGFQTLLTLLCLSFIIRAA